MRSARANNAKKAQLTMLERSAFSLFDRSCCAISLDRRWMSPFRKLSRPEESNIFFFFSLLRAKTQQATNQTITIYLNSFRFILLDIRQREDREFMSLSRAHQKHLNLNLDARTPPPLSILKVARRMGKLGQILRHPHELPALVIDEPAFFPACKGIPIHRAHSHAGSDLFRGEEGYPPSRGAQPAVLL